MKRCLILFIALLAIGSVNLKGAVFTDDFEGPALNTFWTQYIPNGYGQITYPSTVQHHGGNQSVQLQLLQAPSSGEAQINHTYPTLMYGSFSVWVYDSWPGNYNGNYINVLLSDSASKFASLNIEDWDGAKYWWGTEISGGDVQTAISRTLGWHQFSITSLPNELTMKIDGTVVHTQASGFPFNTISWDHHAPGYRPIGLISYFDDFMADTQPVPEPSTIVLLGIGAIGLLVYTRRRWKSAA